MKKTKTKTRHVNPGGKREGAGAPLRYKTKTQSKTVSLPEDLVEYIEGLRVAGEPFSAPLVRLLTRSQSAANSRAIATRRFADSGS